MIIYLAYSVTSLMNSNKLQLLAFSCSVFFIYIRLRRKANNQYHLIRKKKEPYNCFCSGWGRLGTWNNNCIFSYHVYNV